MTKRYALAYACSLASAFGWTTPTGNSPKLPPSTPEENAKPLQSTLTLDRDTYFSGEAGLFTLTVRNPASTPVAVPTPFSATSGCFSLARRLDGGDPAPLSAKPICPFRFIEARSSATTVLAGGEERQATLSSDTLISALQPWARNVGPLNRPGYYQVEYLDQSPRPSAVFRVVSPHLDAAAVVKLNDVTYTDPGTSQIVYVPAYRHVFALRWNNQTFICVSQAADSRDRVISADQRGDYTGGDFPYVRIATSSDPIRSITATADSQDHLTIAWQDSTFHWHMKLLGNGAADPVAGAIQVGLDSTFERLSAAEARQFTATVLGASNTNLKWSVSLAPGAPAGAQPGTVNAAGNYSAPAKITRPYRVILTARSLADDSRSAVAVVSLLAGSSVPTSAGLSSPENKTDGATASPLAISTAKPAAGPLFSEH